jgi:hypothetical protein
MKKFSLFIVLSLVTAIGFSQSMYNDWINYNLTYYKFKIGSTGLYRINVADLAAIGLANEPAENFQLWRNGKQVTLFTSQPTGALGTGGYIEFWGERNDGVTDKDLYRRPEYQISDQESLLTDTASFFLAASPTGTKLGLQMLQIMLQEIHFLQSHFSFIH